MSINEFDEKTDPSVEIPANQRTSGGVRASHSSDFPAFIESPGLTILPDLGELDSYFRNPTVDEIHINGLKSFTWLESGVTKGINPVPYRADELQRLARQLSELIGQKRSGSLGNGLRVTVVASGKQGELPLISVVRAPISGTDMLEWVNRKWIELRAAQFLKACVSSRLKVAIFSDDVASRQKFALALMAQIPKTQRVLSIEHFRPHKNLCFNGIKLERHEWSKELLQDVLGLSAKYIVLPEAEHAPSADLTTLVDCGHGLVAAFPESSLREPELLNNFDVMVFIRQDSQSGIYVVSGVAELDSSVGTQEFRYVFRNGVAVQAPLCLAKINASGLSLPVSFFQAASVAS